MPLGVLVVLLGAIVCAAPRAEKERRKMADGVDHIDIYADVEEEFNQVKDNLFHAKCNFYVMRMCAVVCNH